MKSILAAITVCFALLASATTATAQSPRVLSSRHAGPTRFETAIASAQALYPQPHRASGAIVARADNPADAVSVAPLAKLLGDHPLLVTMKDQLHPAVREELKRLVKPGGTITIAGGPVAIAPEVETQIRELGFVVDRVAGNTRADTAARIADRVHAIRPVREVYIADATDWSEALMLAPLAANRHGVVLLSNASLNPKETRDWIQNHQGLNRIAGFTNPGDPNQLLTDPWVGSSTVSKSMRVAWEEFDRPTQVGVATYLDFPDALSAATLMANVGGPVVFTDNRAETKPLVSGLDFKLQDPRTRPDVVHIFGGEKAVPLQVEDALTDPSWLPHVQVPGGSGCTPGKGEELPDGVWYAWAWGGETVWHNEDLPKPGEQIGYQRLLLVCYDEVTNRWMFPNEGYVRFVDIWDWPIAHKLIANGGEGASLGRYTIRNHRVVDFSTVPQAEKLRYEDVPEIPNE